MIEQTPNEQRTERLLFEGGAVKIEHPKRSYNQTQLKQAFAMPGAEKLLRVARVDVNEREYKKVRDAGGEGPIAAVRDASKAAEVETGAAPTVKVER